MLLHLLLTTTFFALPLALMNYANLDKAHHAFAYLPILILAFIAMVPFIIIAEKKRKMKNVFIGAIVVLGLSQLGWAWGSHSLPMILFCLWLFFTAFNILEASLPSMMSKLAPIENKGTAMGVYSSAQFIGAFMGGILGGVMYMQFGLEGIFLASAVLVILWLLLVLPMQAPKHLSSRILVLPDESLTDHDGWLAALYTIEGIKEAVVVPEEKVAYIKYAPDETNIEELDAFALAQ
jgi:MFS family permease